MKLNDACFWEHDDKSETILLCKKANIGCIGLRVKQADTVFWLCKAGAVFSYKLRYIVGFWLVEMAISTNQKPTIYRNLYENTGPG